MRAQNVPPDFVIVGAPKCGTTALYRFLAGHPQVFMTSPKEPHYFATDLRSPHYITGRDAYLSLFRDAPAGAMRGEASVHYIVSERAVDNLLDHNPRAKCIAMVRNPVDMARSWHAQLLYNGEEEVQDFEAAWRLQESRARGRDLPGLLTDARMAAVTRDTWSLQYRNLCALGQQARRLCDRVPAGQLLILALDDMRADPGACFATVTDFLGIEAAAAPELGVVNASRRPRSAALARFINWSRFVNHPRVRSLAPLFERLGIHPLRALRRMNTARNDHRPLSPAFRAELAAAFEPEIALLESCMGRSLAHWRVAAREDGDA